ncbi:hypothetical protein Tco_0598912 [Tanacetum coccineum]
MEIKDKLDLDQNGTLVDATKYRSMIGALMYLTSSRPDIVHATCLCARYQAKPTEKHLKEDSGFELTGFSDADYAGCKDTFNSTSGGTQFLGEKLTDYQLADLFTKALPVDRFNYLVRRLGMRSLSPQEIERLTKSRQNWRDLPRNTPLDRIEVLASKGHLGMGRLNKFFTLIVLSTLRRSEVFQSRSIQDYLKAKDQDIKFKDKDIKSKIKIQDHKHAKVSLKEFPRIQGSKTQDVTISDSQFNDHPLGGDC